MAENFRYDFRLNCVSVDCRVDDFDSSPSPSKIMKSFNGMLFSVYKVITLLLVGFTAQKNVVIRGNIANIVDSVITR